MPMTRRTSAPAPLASTSGTTPAMNATEVITIGRSRSRQASTAASTIPRPRCSNSRANSTIRMAFLQASPINTTRPILTKMLLSPPVNHTAKSAESMHIGTIRITASGRVQLS